MPCPYFNKYNGQVKMEQVVGINLKYIQYYSELMPSGRINYFKIQPGS